MDIVIEIIGITATLLILVSMCFKTTSPKGALCMRIINIVGSAVFVVYGILLPAISTAILNGALIIVNTYHTIFLMKSDKNKKQENETQNSQESQNNDKTEN